MESNKYGNDKLEFRQIVLMHIKKVLEISSSELRNKTITKNHGNFSETTDCEDTRKSYIQSIENLAYVLIPYFDDDIKKIYEECIKIITSFDFEIKKDLTDMYNEISKDTGKTNFWSNLILEMKLRSSKKLFVALNLLLKRNDYLKSSIYGEDQDEIVNDKEKEFD